MLTPCNVYLPVDQTVLDHIDRGSGIVGVEDGERILLYFEGNRFGYANVVTFADRVMIAAGRMQERYPTIARMSVEVDSVRKVGRYDGSRRISLVGEEIDSLAAWIGCPVHALPNEMQVTR